MTMPELAVFRDRIFQLAVDAYQPTDDPWADGPLAQAVADYRVALAEVERLTAERDQALLERDQARNE